LRKPALAREEVLEKQFAAGLRELVIPREVLEWLQEGLAASDVLQSRLDVLYDDRLDRRIDATAYDKRAADIRRHRMKSADVSTSGRKQGYRQPAKLWTYWRSLVSA